MQTLPFLFHTILPSFRFLTTEQQGGGWGMGEGRRKPTHKQQQKEVTEVEKQRALRSPIIKTDHLLQGVGWGGANAYHSQ